MSMLNNTLGRYFAGPSWWSAVGVFASIFLLLVLVDYIEMVRRTSGLVSGRHHGCRNLAVSRAATARKDMPFCILIGAMTATCAVAASGTGGGARRGRFGLAVHAPALASALALGAIGPSPTIRCPPICVKLSKRMEAEAVRLRARRRAAGCLGLLDQPVTSEDKHHQRRAQASSRASG